MVGVLTAMVADALYFPIWWYTEGLFGALMAGWNSVRGTARSFMIDVWLKNLFVPMFGRYDWQSRLISFVVRLVQVVARSMALLVWAAVVTVAFAVYLVLPLIILLGFVAPWL